MVDASTTKRQITLDTNEMEVGDCRSGGRPADLARSTMVTTGGISKRLDRLEKAGLVRRTRPATGDGRATQVELTPLGLARIDAAFTDHMANERRLLDQLEPAQHQALEDTLRHWLRRFEEPA